MKIFRTLMTQYLAIILAAFALWPILPAIYYSPYFLFNIEKYDTQRLMEMWNKEATALDGSRTHEINLHLQSIHTDYPEAQIFWVDGKGNTMFIEEHLENIPEKWTFMESLVFLEDRKFDFYQYLQGNVQEKYTITSLIGNDPNQGIMIFQIPSSKTNLGLTTVKDTMFFVFFFGISTCFLIISWLFFYNIRKRLVRLQYAMTDTAEEGIPKVVSIKTMDEIGKLQESFNEMIGQLKRSREREEQEEILRKQLTANISHDLRTPLTVMRQHVYTVQKAPSSSKGTDSLKVIENKLNDMDKMIHNLLSYSLLSAGKYPIKLRETNILDELLKGIVEWYPVFEGKGFTVDIDLPEKTITWMVDPFLFRNILDNLFQNVLRHASSGKYIGISIIEEGESTFIVIKDRGKGFNQESETKGAGIGLSIVDLMVKEMNLKWYISSNIEMTCIYLGMGHLNNLNFEIHESLIDFKKVNGRTEF